MSDGDGLRLEGDFGDESNAGVESEDLVLSPSMPSVYTLQRVLRGLFEKTRKQGVHTIKP